METRGQEMKKLEDTFKGLLRDHMENQDKDVQEIRERQSKDMEEVRTLPQNIGNSV